MKSNTILPSFCLFVKYAIILFAFGSGPYAQDYRVTGLVLEKGTQLPIEFASVTLYNSDSTIVGGVLTDSTGKFQLRNLNPDTYYLKIIFMGFENFVYPKIVLSESSSDLILGNLELKPTAFQLDEVSVSTRGLSMRITADRHIVESKNNEASAGGNAVDLLRTSPLIRENPDRKLTIHGDPNLIVLIDSRPSDLPAQEVLKQIPAWQIDKIEIMTHPSARYSAGGTAGIINIILKKNVEHGLNGLLTFAGGLYDKYSSGLQINRNSKKFQTTLSLDWKNEKITQNHQYYKTRTYGDTIEIASMLQDRNLQECSVDARFNATFLPTAEDKWNYSLHGGQNKRNIFVRALLEGYTDPVHMHRFDQNDFKIELRPTFITQNLAYIRQLPKDGSSISANLFYSYIDYLLFNSQVQFPTTSNFESIDSMPNMHNVLNKNFSKESKIDVDWIYPIEKNNIIEAGLSYRYYNRILHVSISDYNYDRKEWANDVRYTGVYQYFEKIYSGYLNTQFNLREIKFTTGLRVEYMDRSLEKTESGLKFPFSRFHIFPNLLVEKSFNEQWIFTTNYSSRINRPDEYQMNPFPEFEDPYFYAEGNPELFPEISHRAEIGLRRMLKDGSITTSLYYRNTTDKIFQELIVRSDGKLKVISSNRATEQTLGIDLNYNFSPAPRISLQTGVSAYHYRIKGFSGTEAFDNKSPVWNVNVMGAFHVHKNISLQLLTIFNSRETYPLGYSKELWLMNLGVDWRLFNDQFIANLSVRDVFKTGDFFVHTSTDLTMMDAYYYNEHPSIRLSFKYYFRKYKKLTHDIETKFDM